jgi:CIC family chloride channel protein
MKSVQSEIHEYLNISRQRRWIFPRAAFVGLAAGFLALLFRMALAGAEKLRNLLIEYAGRYPRWGWLFPVLLTLTCSMLAVFLTRRFAPEAAGSGIPHLKAFLLRFRTLEWKRLLPVKFFGGILSIGGGLALGREGPTVQMGGAVGDLVSRMLKVPRRERLTLVSAGAGAGLSAAFNAPLSGLIFVLEEVRRDFQPVIFGAAFIAAAVANIVAQVGSGPFPVFIIPSYPVMPLLSLPVFALLGVLAGVVGVLFNKALLVGGNLFGRIPRKLVLPATALIGGGVGLVGWFNPGLIGSGHHLAESALKGDVALWLIPLFFLIRMVLTVSSYSTGAPGGIFAPMLVFGSLLGLFVGRAAQYWFPEMVTVPGAFAVVGMAACFTAIVRAPLTGIVLIIEMTGNYSLMLPLLVSCFFAYAAAELFKSKPIYEAMLLRDLKKGAEDIPVRSEPQVLEFTVGEKSPFGGKSVRDLGLPTGCLIIRCSDGKKEWVPTADMILVPHLHVTVVVAIESPETLSLLNDGFLDSGK